jgi:transposase
MSTQSSFLVMPLPHLLRPFELGGRRPMQVVHERCAGLDVHRKMVVACVVTPVGRETRTFGTMTDDLEALAVWLEQQGVTDVAMESTGVYWKPVYNVLEQYPLELLLANAQHMKAVPGRKTDVKDAEWIADLLRHGLLRASYVPSRAERELRELVRYRKSLIRERATEANRVQKVLEGANIKLAAVASDVLGKSGRAMLAALSAGTTDPHALAALAQGKLQDKLEALERALRGVVGDHQRLLLATQLRHIAFLEEEIARLSAEIAERQRPFAAARARLQTIPGVGPLTAEVILAEVGPDLSRFPSAGHLASWAGLCPGHHESAGKRKSGRTRDGDVWLTEALVQAAQAAARTRATYLAAQYRRIAARRGAKRALVAVAHSILVIAYHLLSRGTEYQELGGNYFDERDQTATLTRAVARINRLGFDVELTPKVA